MQEHLFVIYYFVSDKWEAVSDAISYSSFSDWVCHDSLPWNRHSHIVINWWYPDTVGWSDCQNTNHERLPIHQAIRDRNQVITVCSITIKLKCETTISQLFKIFILQFYYFFYLSLVSITTVVFCNLPSFSILVSISLYSVQALYYNIKSFVVKIDWE